MNRIKRYTEQVFAEHKAEFGLDFAENRKALKAIATVRSKELQNEIAGYITRTLKRERREMEERRRRAAADAEQERSSIDEAEGEGLPAEATDDAPAGGASEGPSEGKAFVDGGAVVAQEDSEIALDVVPDGEGKAATDDGAAAAREEPSGKDRDYDTAGGDKKPLGGRSSSRSSGNPPPVKPGGDKRPLQSWSSG